KQNEQVS
ncbi:aspartate kinase domain protein, partial [Vibrio parahaemolyticus V-223/04]